MLWLITYEVKLALGRWQDLVEASAFFITCLVLVFFPNPEYSESLQSLSSFCSLFLLFTILLMGKNSLQEMYFRGVFENWAKTAGASMWQHSLAYALGIWSFTSVLWAVVIPATLLLFGASIQFAVLALLVNALLSLNITLLLVFSNLITLVSVQSRVLDLLISLPLIFGSLLFASGIFRALEAGESIAFELAIVVVQLCVSMLLLPFLSSLVIITILQDDGG